MRRQLHHLQETALTGLTFLFGLQLVKSFLAGLEAVRADLATLAIYGLVLALAVTAVHLARLTIGPRAAIALTAGGLALVRVVEQVAYTPDLDLGLATAGTALFGLGVLLGFGADTAINGALGALGTLDLSWHDEVWASALVFFLAGLLWLVLWTTVGRPSRPWKGLEGGINLPVLALGPVLVLQLFMFQDIGRQTQLVGWDQPAVFAAMALANAGGVAFASYAMTLRGLVYPPITILLGAAFVAVILLDLSGSLAVWTILLAQLSIGLTMVLMGMALGSGRGPGRLTRLGLGAAAALLLVALFLASKGAYGPEPYVVGHRTASMAAAIVLLCALAAALALAEGRSAGPPVWAPTVVAAVILVPAGISWLAWDGPVSGRSLTGVPVAGMKSFDRGLIALMERWQIRGGALAIARDGRLVLARGYGLGDVERNEPVQPDSLFRIASVSKPITSAAVLKLVEDGRLDIEGPGLDGCGVLEAEDDAGFALLLGLQDVVGGPDEHHRVGPLSEPDIPLGQVVDRLDEILSAHDGGVDSRDAACLQAPEHGITVPVADVQAVNDDGVPVKLRR